MNCHFVHPEKFWVDKLVRHLSDDRPLYCVLVYADLVSQSINACMCTGAVDTADLKWVVIDWYWRDQKLRRFSDVPEVHTLHC